MRLALGLTIAAGQGLRAAIAYNNLAVQVSGFDGPAPAMAVVDEAIAFVAVRGLRGEATTLEALRLLLQFDRGNHDEIRGAAPALEGRLEAQGAIVPFLVELRATVIRILLLRGESPNPSMVEWIEQVGGSTEDAETALLCHGIAACARDRLGDPARAAALLESAADETASAARWWFPRLLPMLARQAVALGLPDLAERLIDRCESRYPYAQAGQIVARACVNEARGDLVAAADGYEDAVARWTGIGVEVERAFALLGLGRVKTGLGRADAATDPLRAAEASLAALHAKPTLREVHRLLSGSTSSSMHDAG